MAEPQHEPRVYGVPGPPAAYFDSVIGLSEAEATKIISDYGYKVFVGRRDASRYPRIMNLDMTRVNLEVDAGVVSTIKMG